MDTGQLIAGMVLLIFGGLSAVKPEAYINYQKWVFGKIMGAEYRPTPKTITIQRMMGVLFVLLGLAALGG